ncbi:hypothetical protein [Pseudoduganella dura]|uniref:hypothetical protein n=1 Tax=Pseudoduganella dura TaxID=321982 RepID=UPI001672AF91|nr:hypothetical protein [Pseudoduganella dura]GGX82677.1 hypothetical protein GCM10007386_12090 [Pseudoduganella dura]
MPTRCKLSGGKVHSHPAVSTAAGLPEAPVRRALVVSLRSALSLQWFARAVLPVLPRSAVPALLPGTALAALLAGCATLTESTEQYVMVQTVLDHQQVAGVGCVLTNDAGRWFVTSPGRVRIRKSTKPLAVDCRLNDVYVRDEISPRQNSSRWGNILLTAGTGQLVDRQTGAGFDYPGTLTVLLKRVPPPPPPVAAAPPPALPPAPPPPPPPPPPKPPQPPGGSAIY